MQKKQLKICCHHLKIFQSLILSRSNLNKNNIVFIITAVTVVAAVNFLRFFYNHGIMIQMLLNL